MSPDPSDFYYYTQFVGTLIGKGSVEGAEIMVGKAGPAFQLGIGANPTNTTLSFGGAGWITATIVRQPTTSTSLTIETNARGGNGDININLSGAPTACFENRGTISANCIEDITITAASGTTSQIVTWDAPTFTSDCIFNSNASCENMPNDLEGFSYAGTLNGSQYFISSNNYTYAQARSLAIQQGGHIAVICGQEENDFLVSKMTTNVAWIGFTDEHTEGTFIWANGAYCSYTNWIGNDPNDGHSTNEFTGADHTVLRREDGGWLDRNGQALYAFILEIPCTGTSTDVTAPMVQTQGPASGDAFPIGETTITYEGKDDCGNVQTCSFKVNVVATSPCSGGAPAVTVNATNPTCGQDDGKIIFSFDDHSSRTNIEFSLDGGQTYPLYVSDKVGTATFDNLVTGKYELFVRWGNDDCPVNLGVYSLEEDAKTPGTSCDDGDHSTESDEIQADGCTCLGNLIGNRGCDELFINSSFEDGLSPWRFNSNTQYNQSTRYVADGNFIVWIYKRYSYKDDAVIYQDAPALPGAVYSFSFHAGTHEPSHNHEVAIEFYNTFGAKLARKAIQIDYDVDNGNALQEYQLEETAPSGTTKIRFVGISGGNYLKLDDICVQIDKSNVESSGRSGGEEEEKEDGPELEDRHVLYYDSDAVTLASLVKNEGVQLEWFTKNPDLPSLFIIEKSLDGENFEQIDEVMVEEYDDLSILDESPEYGTNYYRVIQRFNTGEEIVSNVREEKYMLDPASITLYPNPVADNLNLRIGHFKDLEGTVRIFSPAGQQVFEQTLDSENKHLSINVSDYKNGMYFLIIDQKRGKAIERQFIVENLK